MFIAYNRDQLCKLLEGLKCLVKPFGGDSSGWLQSRIVKNIALEGSELL